MLKCGLVATMQSDVTDYELKFTSNDCFSICSTLPSLYFSQEQCNLAKQQLRARHERGDERSRQHGPQQGLVVS